MGARCAIEPFWLSDSAQTPSARSQKLNRETAWGTVAPSLTTCGASGRTVDRDGAKKQREWRTDTQGQCGENQIGVAPSVSCNQVRDQRGG